MGNRERNKTALGKFAQLERSTATQEAIMLLRHFYLGLSNDGYPGDVYGPFSFRTRYLTNFIEERLRKKRFHAEGFNNIVILGHPNPREECPIVSDRAVAPQVEFDQNKYESLVPDEYHEFFMSMLIPGIEKCARHHEIPKQHLLDSIAAFRAAEYRNEWIHKRKIVRELGIIATLHCKMDYKRFVLTLEIERDGRIVFSKDILETPPDEIIFEWQYKHVSIKDHMLLLSDKFSREHFRINLVTLEHSDSFLR